MSQSDDFVDIESDLFYDYMVPIISVIIPSLNEEKYIERCLKSIRSQKYKGEFELIVADGGSTDRTVDIAKKYNAKIVVEKEKGIAKGRNAGAKKAKGKILLFIDADTKVPRNLLGDVEGAFKKNEVVGVAAPVLPETPSFKNVFSYWFYNTCMRLSSAIRMPLLGGMCVAYRKDVFKKVGGFDDRLKSGEDLDISQRIRKYGRCKVLGGTYVVTSTRRLDDWGILTFVYRYTKGFVLGKVLGRGEYEPVR